MVEKPLKRWWRGGTRTRLQLPGWPPSARCTLGHVSLCEHGAAGVHPRPRLPPRLPCVLWSGGGGGLVGARVWPNWVDAASCNLYIVGVLRLRNYQFAHPPWYSKLGDHMGITVIVLSEVFGLAGFFPRGPPVRGLLFLCNCPWIMAQILFKKFMVCFCATWWLSLQKKFC